jgi:hypothetical protein
MFCGAGEFGFFRRGGGVRAEWQEARKMQAGLQQIAATMTGSRGSHASCVAEGELAQLALVRYPSSPWRPHQPVAQQRQSRIGFGAVSDRFTSVSEAARIEEKPGAPRFWRIDRRLHR